MKLTKEQIKKLKKGKQDKVLSGATIHKDHETRDTTVHNK